MTGTYEYDVFGGVRAQTGTTTEWSYTGEQNDPTGLEYLRARYYDANTGRFLSQDPLPLLQRYAYANDNPANLVDPSGLSPFEQLMAAERAIQAAARQILDDPCWKTRAFCKHVALVWRDGKQGAPKVLQWSVDYVLSDWNQAQVVQLAGYTLALTCETGAGCALSATFVTWSWTRKLDLACRDIHDGKLTVNEASKKYLISLVPGGGPGFDLPPGSGLLGPRLLDRVLPNDIYFAPLANC